MRVRGPDGVGTASVRPAVTPCLRENDSLMKQWPGVPKAASGSGTLAAMIWKRAALSGATAVRMVGPISGRSTGSSR